MEFTPQIWDLCQLPKHCADVLKELCRKEGCENEDKL